jgi:hypothetical protein
MPGFSSPAAIATLTAPAAPAPFSTFLRKMFMQLSPIYKKRFSLCPLRLDHLATIHRYDDITTSAYKNAVQSIMVHISA